MDEDINDLYNLLILSNLDKYHVSVMPSIKKWQFSLILHGWK